MRGATQFTLLQSATRDSPRITIESALLHSTLQEILDASLSRSQAPVIRIVIFLSSFLALSTLSAQQLEGPIETRIDQWQPVLPGTWTVSTKSFGVAVETTSPASSTQARVSACPYASLFILRSRAPVKLGEPGCQFSAYRVSTNQYHIVARCRTLAGKDHYETTTLTVSNAGKAFSSATTWVEPKGSITARADGVWSAACGRE
jgi:hypothetical protein